MNSVPEEIELTPNQLRQMQLIQLEMLIELDRICRKNGIKYSLDGGTLLGAVRHKGFIPWDDDIDIIMLRSEYEHFFEMSKKDLDKNRFFLQDYRTDPYYHVGYARLRRKGTVYHRTGHEHMKYKGGIFIDLFILDSVPDSTLVRPINRFICYIFRRMLWAESGRVLHPRVLGRKWFQLLSYIPRNLIFSLLNKYANHCNLKKTMLVRHMTHPYPKRCKYGIQRKYFEELAELRFEGYAFFATKYFKEYLSDLYNDYTTLPPIEKRKVHIHLSGFIPVIPELENRELIKQCFHSVKTNLEGKVHGR